MALQASPSAQRAVDIVVFLARHPGDAFSVAGLARSVGQSRATCQSVLLALQDSDWVRRQESGGYTLGAGLIAVGAAAERGAGVVELLRPAAEALYLRTDCEVFACVPAGSDLVVVARAGASHAFAVAATVGQAFRIAPPFGLSFAAWSDVELDRWIALAPDLDRRERGRLEEAAGLVREHGFAVTLDTATRAALSNVVDSLPPSDRARVGAVLAQDDFVIDAGRRRTLRFAHVSAPIFGAGDRVVGMLGINLSADDARRVPDILDALHSTVARLSDRLQTLAGSTRTAVPHD